MKTFSILVELFDWDFLTFLYRVNGKNVENVCNLSLSEISNQYEYFQVAKGVITNI